MSDTVGKLVIGIELDNRVKEGGERAKADARKLKKDMDSILAIGTPLSFSAGKHLVHNDLTLQGAAYNAAMKAQTQGAILQSMSMFGTGAMGRAASMPQRDFVAMAMGSWEKNRGIQLRSQIQVADEISRREEKAAKYRLAYDKAVALREEKQRKQEIANAAVSRKQALAEERKASKAAEQARKQALAEERRVNRDAVQAQKQAARMDPANNLRRGFVGGMFGSPMGTASTIGTSAMVGAAAGFMGGMVASAVISGIGRIKDAVIGLGVESIKTSSSIEMLRLRLDTVTQGKGEETFRNLMQVAIDLRAPVEGIIASFSKMTAMGFQPTMDQLKGLVNYTRMLGDPQNLDYIVLAFSQIASKGKLEMQELRQLAERGVPALSIIMEKLNVPISKIGDIGKLFIPGGKAVEALMTGIQERIGDIQAEYRDTMMGLVDYVKLLWFQMKLAIGDSGLFSSFKGFLRELTTVMESDGFKNMSADIGAMFKQMMSGLRGVVSFISSHWDMLSFMGKWLGVPMASGMTGMVVGGGIGAVLGGTIGFLSPVPGGLMAGASLGGSIGAKIGGVAGVAGGLATVSGSSSEEYRPKTDEGVERYRAKAARRLAWEAKTAQQADDNAYAMFEAARQNMVKTIERMDHLGLTKILDNVEDSFADALAEAQKLPMYLNEKTKQFNIYRSITIDSVQSAIREAKDKTILKYYKDFADSLRDAFEDMTSVFGDDTTRELAQWNKKMGKFIEELGNAPDDKDGRKANAILRATEEKRKGAEIIRAKSEFDFIKNFKKDSEETLKSFYDDLETINLTDLEKAIRSIDKAAEEMYFKGIIPDKDIEKWRSDKINEAMRGNDAPSFNTAAVVGTEEANRRIYGGSQSILSTIAKNTGENVDAVNKLRESVEKKRTEAVKGTSQEFIDATGLKF